MFGSALPITYFLLYLWKEMGWNNVYLSQWISGKCTVDNQHEDIVVY